MHFQTLYIPGLINPADYASKITPPEKYVGNWNWTMWPKFLENHNGQIELEYALDRISDSKKSNTLENIWEEIEENRKPLA